MSAQQVNSVVTPCCTFCAGKWAGGCPCKCHQGATVMSGPDPELKAMLDTHSLGALENALQAVKEGRAEILSWDYGLHGETVFRVMWRAS